jgi:hypothetical protein
MGAGTGVGVDAGGFAGVGVAGGVDPEAVPALGAVTEVEAAGVEVDDPAELLEPQPLSMENKGTNAARAGTVNVLTWNVMAAFSYRGMNHPKRKRRSMTSAVTQAAKAVCGDLAVCESQI